MRVSCYEDGLSNDGGDPIYDEHPDVAARIFAKERLSDAAFDGEYRYVVVEAVDDVASALPDWQSDEEGVLYKVYRLRAAVTWQWHPETGR